MRLIRTNLIWAATYNAIGIAVAATGYLHPIAAALLMVGSSLIVTGRSIRFAESLMAGNDAALPQTPSKLASSQLESEFELQSACVCK